MSFYLHKKNWVTIKEEVKHCKTVIVPLGSMEAHGPHNPVGCCYLLADSASKSVGEITKIPVTPVIPFGVSDPYLNFPGTITVTSNSLSNYVKDVCQSLIRSGYKKIIFFSAHGGNNLPVLREIALELRKSTNVLCPVVHLWGLLSQLVKPGLWGKEITPGHGGEPTTSTILYLHPELVDIENAKNPTINNPLEGFQTLSHESQKLNGLTYNIPLFAEEITSNSTTGNPSKASKETGQILYNQLIDCLVEFVEKIDKLDIK
jgi:creatinine amidohydrolase